MITPYDVHTLRAIIRQTLIDLIKNRITCSCCDSDETCASFITTLLQRTSSDLWPTLGDVSSDGTTESMQALIEEMRVGLASGAATPSDRWRNGRLYLPILLALRDRRLS